MDAVDVARGRDDAPGLEVAAYRSLSVYERADRVGGRSDIRRLWRDNGERGVGPGATGRHRPDDDRLAGDVLDVAFGISEPYADCRLRVVLERHLVGQILRDEVGEQRPVPGRRADFAEVVPAVAVGVFVRVIRIDAGVGRGVRLLPPRLHHVVVGEYLAVVLSRVDVPCGVVERLGRAEEVVGHLLLERSRVGVDRAEEVPAVRETVGIRPEARGVLRVVGKPVVVSVVVAVLRGDAEEVLPPVGDAVAVGVRVDRVRGVYRAVRLEAAVYVDRVREAGLHAGAVVVDERVPADRHRGRFPHPQP